MQFPQAYLITWGTYGTRLHGSSKPYVDRANNQFGSPLPLTNLLREKQMCERMTRDPIYLNETQRRMVVESIAELALRYEWKVHAIAVQKDHAHCVVTASREGTALRDALKSVSTRVLNREFEKRRWWAEGGSAKYLWERSYFENAVRYVSRQRDF